VLDSSIRAAALILATWIAENAPEVVKQSSLGFAPQNGHFNDIGLVGSTGIIAFQEFDLQPFRAEIAKTTDARVG